MKIRISERLLNAWKEYQANGFAKIEGEGAYLEQGADILARCDEDNPADLKLMQTLEPFRCYLTIDGGEVLGEVNSLADLYDYFKDHFGEE